jgi:hypothetical protein
MHDLHALARHRDEVVVARPVDDEGGTDAPPGGDVLDRTALERPGKSPN